MPVITATEVTILSNISASAATITAKGLIPLVQERINFIAHNWFTTDLYLQTAVTFNATARTITTTSGDDWAAWNFIANDEVYVYQSYRNDGYYTIDSVSGSALTLVTGSSVTDELSGRSILFSVVKWPADIRMTAALMVEYDYDIRKKRSPGIRSRSLGPWSESYSNNVGEFGYPAELIAPLYDHRIVSLV